MAELASVTRNVQEHEPETTIYYAYSIADKNEVIVVERCVTSTICPLFPLFVACQYLPLIHY